MKLLLTSTGLTNENVRNFFVSQFDKLDNKTACVITSGRTKEEQFYIDEALKEMSDLGIKVTELNIAQKDSFPNLPEFDIYYVCGGNTFYILERMRMTGIDQVLTDAVKSGKFYLGVSAGSIVAGPDIEISGWGKNGDPNEVGLQDLTGLDLVLLLVTPHYTQEEEADVNAFKEKRKGEMVIELTDDQAVFVEDGKMFRI